MSSSAITDLQDGFHEEYVNGHIRPREGDSAHCLVFFLPQRFFGFDLPYQQSGHRLWLNLHDQDRFPMLDLFSLQAGQLNFCVRHLSSNRA